MDVVDSAGPDLLAEEFERELEAAYEESLAPKSRPWRLAIAASLALLMVASAALIGVFVITEPAQQYATAIGEQRTVILDDGSSVQLNTNSRIEVAYRSGHRDVELKQGEAYFDVVHNEQRPFAVHTRFGDVVVTGTSFNVRSFSSQMEVSVLSGGVNVSAARGEEIHPVIAGYSMRVDQNGASHLTKHDHTGAPAWLEGKVHYENQPLGEVIADLNRYFRRKISLSDEKLAQSPVTGEFDITDPDTATQALSVAFNLKTRTTPQGVILEPAETNLD